MAQTEFQTEYLFKRLPDFWSYFEDREDQKNIWDAFLRKSQALYSLLRGANFSKSLKSIPILDRNQLEYFVFSKLVRRTDLERNSPFYVYEVDPTIFFIKNLYEKIDATESNRVLSSETYYRITHGTGTDAGKTFLEFLRGVAPVAIGETFWTKGSIEVEKKDGSKFVPNVSEGDIIQAPSGVFFKVTSIVSDTKVTVQGTTVIGQALGSGDGVTTVFNLRTPDLFVEVGDDFVLTGPVPAGTYSLTLTPPGNIYDPASLKMRYGPTFDTGLELTLGTHYAVADPNAGTFSLTAAGVLLLGTDQLHARYDRAEAYIIPSSAEIRLDGRILDPITYYADELVATGPVAPGLFQLDYFPVDAGSLDLRGGSITGTPLLNPADYTVNLANGQVTLTVAGAAKVNATSSKEIHAKYSRTEYVVDAYGRVTFTSAPATSVSSITADYFLGYFGPTGYTRRTMREGPPTKLFSRAVYRDRSAVYSNFGYAIGYEKPTSLKYLNEVRGLYFARYNGPTITNMDLGAGILAGIPFAPRGKVDRVKTTIPKSIVVGGDLYPVPDPLTPIVSAGDFLSRDFNLLTDGVRTADFINDPALFQLDPIYDDIRKFFTFFVLVKGSYATWVCQQTGQPIDYSVLTKFVSDIKPSYTDAMVLTDMDYIADNINFFIGAVDVQNSLDATYSIEFNPLNYCIIPQYMKTNGYSYTVADEVLATAPVAAGLYALDFDEILPLGVQKVLVADELLGTGDGVQTNYQVDLFPVSTSPALELRKGDTFLTGTVLALATHYTFVPATGAVTLTPAGVVFLGTDQLRANYMDDPTTVPFELHLGTIAGPTLAPGVDYTLNEETGVVTLLTPQTQDIHAKYTSGIVGENALAVSDTVDLDLDCIQLYEEFDVVGDSVGISTLENNLVNFGVSPPGPEGMDDDTIQMAENMDVNEAVGTPPGSGNPPFSAGALIYSF